VSGAKKKSELPSLTDALTTGFLGLLLATQGKHGEPQRMIVDLTNAEIEVVVTMRKKEPATEEKP
jgi:hypothetical protein